MNRRIRSFVLAATCVAGVAIAVAPQHAWSIVRVAAVAVTTLVGAAVLVAVGAFTKREPEPGALDRSTFATTPPLDPHGLRDARRDLDRPAVPGSVPPVIRERLMAAALLRLRAAGVDIDAPGSRVRARALMTPGTWTLLSTPSRPGETRDPDNVAAIVNHTLDDLDGIAERIGAPR